MNAFWQSAFIQPKGEFVGGRGCKVRQSIMQLKNEYRSCQGSKGDTGIASLKTPQGVAADEKALRHVSG